MRRKLGVFCILLGICCLFSSVAVLIFNRHEETRAENASDALLRDVRERITVSRTEESGVPESAEPEAVPEEPEIMETIVEVIPQETVVIPDAEEILPEIPEVPEEADVPEVPPEMPVTLVDGYDCIGVLSIPVLELELPVLNDWSYEKLKTAPCCYYGTYYDPDFVIAAHNYRSHFGKLSELQAEDPRLYGKVRQAVRTVLNKMRAAITGNKKIEMVHVKDLLGLTGYIRGGCSPIGMKKKYPTYMDESLNKHEEITISAGVRGCQLKLNAQALVRFIGASVCSLT